MEKKQKVALGMSGGVDSSLSASLLIEQGYEVTGVYLECWRAPGCRTEEDRQDALKVALQLNIPFKVLDFKEAYRQKVVENFFMEYEAGRTPNPDVLCNKEIKFGLFYDWAMSNNFDYIATGHYARVKNQEEAFFLTSSNDAKKDQTYFLYRLQETQLSHILFPIGHLTKDQVRKEAVARNLPVANKPDSQGICFIGEINVHNFLKERLGEKPGQVVNSSGEVMGEHKGLWFYTIGQRHGFEIFGKWKSQQGEEKHAMPPYYVVGKIPAKNQLIVGFGSETYKKEFVVEDVHLINNKFQVLNSKLQEPMNQSTDELINCLVRIRHGGKLIRAKIKKQKGKIVCQLDEPIQGIAEGQSAVFYAPLSQFLKEKTSTEDMVCLGGGVISVVSS